MFLEPGPNLKDFTMWLWDSMVCYDPICQATSRELLFVNNSPKNRLYGRLAMFATNQPLVSECFSLLWLKTYLQTYIPPSACREKISPQITTSKLSLNVGQDVL